LSAAWSPPSQKEILKSIKDNLSEDRLRFGSSVLGFGRREGDYNEFTDMTLSLGKSQGLRMSGRTPLPGSVVLAAFPDGLVLPAQLQKTNKRISLELPWDVPEGKRCFVLNELGDKVITASGTTTGMEHLPVMPRISLLSWAACHCPSALTEEYEGFDVETRPGGFVITDSKGEKLAGRCMTGEPGEIDEIRGALKRHGLAGILVSYQLSRGKNNG
jgi:hypothetical protein